MSFYTPMSQCVLGSGWRGMRWVCMQNVAVLGIFVIVSLFCYLDCDDGYTDRP